MSSIRGPLLAAALAIVFVPLVTNAQAQAPYQMKVYLGAGNQLEVDAVYRDPVDVDRRLNGTRVIPMRLTAKNTSLQPQRLNYADVTLDLGTADTGLTRLMPVAPALARDILWADGRYNDFVRFIGSSGDRFATIDPFSRVLPDGVLRP